MEFELVKLIVPAVLSLLSIIGTFGVILMIYLKSKVQPTEQEKIEKAMEKMFKYQDKVLKHYNLDPTELAKELITNEEKRNIEIKE